MSVHLGKFLQSNVRMPLAYPKPGGPKTIEVIKTEEKGSDVNLATYLLIDAFRHDSDLAVVVSNDSDLCEPIRIVQQEFSTPVALLIPHMRTSQALSNLNPQFIKQIRQGPLSASQFPQQSLVTRVTSLGRENGRTIPRPGVWVRCRAQGEVGDHSGAAAR